MDCISIPAQVPYSMVGSLSKMIKGDLTPKREIPKALAAFGTSFNKSK